MPTCRCCRAFYFTASAWPLILTVNDSASLDTVPESRRCQLPVDPPERYRVGHLAADDFLGCIQGCGIGEPPSRTEELVLDYGRHDRRSHGQGSAPMSTVVLPVDDHVIPQGCVHVIPQVLAYTCFT